MRYQLLEQEELLEMATIRSRSKHIRACIILVLHLLEATCIAFSAHIMQSTFSTRGA